MSKNDTVYFDLTNSNTVLEIKKLSIEDLLLKSSPDSEHKGTYKPFNIVLKMNGLLMKRKPDFWQVLDKFRETSFDFKFIAIFVDEYKDKESKAKIYLTQALQKSDITTIWIPGPTGLEVNGEGTPVSLAKWEKDLDGKNAINEFIEIIKVPEVFEEVISKSADGQSIYIPGFKKISAGFSNVQNTFDVFFKAVDSIGGTLKTADTVPKINISRPSEIFLGSDLNKDEFITDGEITNKIKEIQSLQETLLNKFGIGKNKNLKKLKSKVDRVRFSIDIYQERLNDRFTEITNMVDDISKEFSSFESADGLSQKEIKRLLDLGIDVSASSSEFEDQGDELINNIGHEIIRTLQDKQTLEVVLPTLDNEIEMLEPRKPIEIESKIKESYDVTLFNKISDISQRTPRALKLLLGKKMWTRFLYSFKKDKTIKVKIRHFILSIMTLITVFSFLMYLGNYREACFEKLGDPNIMELPLSDFYEQFVYENSATSAKCKALLPEPRFYADIEAYQQAIEEQNNAVNKFNAGLVTETELNQVKNRTKPIINEYRLKAQRINNAGGFLIAAYIPLIIYSFLTFISFALLFITDYLLKRWAREIGFNELNLVSKNLESNIGDIVVNDIKYGAKKRDLSNKVLAYKDLLSEVREYFKSKQEEYQNKEIIEDEIDTSYNLVNPQYSEVILSDKIQDQSFFDKFVKVCREEILTILDNSTKNNKDKLFGRSIANFKENSFKEFKVGLEGYINLITEKGILETETSNEKIALEKQDIKKSLWNTSKVQESTVEKVTQASKTTDIMQMVDQNNIQLLDTQNHQWKFFKFIPKNLVSQYKTARGSSTDEFIETNSVDATGFIRLIPVKRNIIEIKS